MKLLVVGDGPVARTFASALERAGESPARWWRRQGGAPPACDVAILAVPDRALTDVAEQILITSPAPALIHPAGGLSADAPFTHLSRRPRGVALLHPLRSLAASAADLRGTVFAVGGDEVGQKIARSLAEKLGGQVLELDPAAQPLYHAAAVMASSHLVGIVDVAADLLVSLGLEKTRAVSALASLLRSVAENLEHHGLPTALTGPIARGDVETVARHLGALKKRPIADALYRATARAVTKVAREKGQAAPTALEKIERML